MGVYGSGLRKAVIKDVREGLSRYGAAAKYGLPYGTICDWVRQDSVHTAVERLQASTATSCNLVDDSIETARCALAALDELGLAEMRAIVEEAEALLR